MNRCNNVFKFIINSKTGHLLLLIVGLSCNILVQYLYFHHISLESLLSNIITFV
jgi:hypothetical protein